jgi:hypothetical protein
VTITKAHYSRRRATRALNKASIACAAALTASAGVASANHIEYDIAQLGYTNTLHTRDNGTRTNSVIDMNAVGQVVGNQVRYNGTATPVGQTAWYFSPGDPNTFVGIGLVDDAHTSAADISHPGGEQWSTVSYLNDLGHAAGVSNRYDGQATQSGQSAWRYMNGTTSRVGLFDNDHSKNNGAAISTLIGLNAQGTVVGNSERYDNSNVAFGYSAYIQTTTDTDAVRIGLDLNASPATYNEHRRSDGLQFSNVTHLNDLGDAAGFTNRYIEDPDGATNGFDLTQIGNSAWVRTAAGATQKVGFTDAEHTRSSDGRKITTIVALNTNNTTGSAVVGHSLRYSPTTSGQQGQTAWMQRVDSATPVRLGFTDDAHTSGNNAAAGGTKSSNVQELNDAGFARGFSTRYNGATASGQSAWVHGPSATTSKRVGLVDAEHTGNNDLQSSTALLMNDVGTTAGTSNRFVGATGARTAAGTSAWRQAFDASTATRVGFFDSSPGATTVDYTRDNDSLQNSAVVAMNELGDVVGHSTRYRGSDTITAGQAAWINDADTGITTRVGLFDFDHTRGIASGDGDQFSTVQFVNDLGQAVGVSRRYNGNDAQAGQSGWFYDGTTSIPLVFDQGGSDNRTFTSISFLSDTGVVLGAYEKFGTDAGNHAFLWDYNLAPADRFHDLGALVDGGLTAAGWSRLTDALEMSPSGHILGIGTLISNGSMPFLMSPIPEPTSFALLALSGLALLPRRRRRQ